MKSKALTKLVNYYTICVNIKLIMSNLNEKAEVTAVSDPEPNLKKLHAVEDVYQKGSRQTGIKGLFEKVLRKFRIATHALALIPLYIGASVCFGVSLQPSIHLFLWINRSTQDFSFAARSLCLGIGLALGFYVYGFTMMLVIPFANFILRCNLKPWRGIYYSFETLKWYVHNGLTYLARYTFLEFFTPTPFNNFFYQMMGMKIGKDTQVNTTHISDPSLIELGNHVTIGGSATIIAHMGAKGFLIISPVKIHDGAVIGIKATIMSGVTVGAHAKVLPNSVVLPNTNIPPGETWGGVPARKIEKEKKSA
jgi:acetyltransferase-like isoleucine patch superfamily enzyme